MRDFRDAKAMAHSLREALAARNLKVTNSVSLELVAKAFGSPDWNTLSAAIKAAASERTRLPYLEFVPRTHAAPLAPGDSVRIVDGHFASFAGVVQKIEEADGSLMVEVVMFGQPTPIWTQPHQLMRSL